MGLMLLSGAAAPLAAQPCSDATIRSVLRAAYPDARTDGRSVRSADGYATRVASVSCKRWPAQPDLLLLAVPLIGPAAEHSSSGDLEVLVAETGTAHVRARYRDRGRLDSDAFFFDDALSLDTARYQLTDRLRAFGVRIGFRNQSGPNPLRQESLDLYVLRNGAVEPVMRKLVVRASWSEWDMRCEGIHTADRRTVAVEPSESRWAALVVRSQARAWRTRPATGGGDCIEFDIESSAAVDRLHFDGRAYSVPSHLEAL
jgi:hypothetical protein